MKNKKTILIQPGRKQVLMEEPDFLLQVLKKNKFPIMHSCGGHGTCGTCVVKVMGANFKLPDRNELEGEMAKDRRYKENERLACQLWVDGDLEIFVKVNLSLTKV